MIAALLLALVAPAASADAVPCIPAATAEIASSALADHRALRATLNEPMPEAATMVMLFGHGGHLSTSEYSIVLARRADGRWDGTAVGRSQIWIKDAPFNPMNRREWTLDREESGLLDAAIARRCPAKPPITDNTPGEPPPRSFVSEKIDVIRPEQPPLAFYVSSGDGSFDALLRPPAYR
ncbi:hypothetical protein [Sphingomonas dokdonensis]|uniref:Uncharacterized protein n=1 Tax=Sphingomonas dokdonensis TaxID=344880 RepID=A0A245ZEC7_9SPHN|nr:hypothetical protein [Sphingomonas dokdonensis]OWK28092.1 hypothetical protein SPDO_29250 [Sphingomonas dokdonensis]